MPLPGISLRRFCRTAAALVAAFLLPLLGAAALAQPVNGHWAGFGPGGGNVSSLAVDPADPSTVHAVASGSVYRSTDGGLTWSAGLGPNFGVVAVDPSHPAIVYAGGATIARSRDGGRTWRVVLAASSLIGSRVAALTVSPAGVVFAGTESRLLRSVDFGRSWTAVLDSVGSLQTVHSIRVDPADPNRVYAATAALLWRSSDGGATWTQMPAPPDQGFPGFESDALALAPSSSSTLYALLTNFLRTEVVRSDDGAATWRQVGEIRSFVGQALAVDPGSASRLYAASLAGIYASADGGQSWSPLQAGLPLPFGHPLPVLSLAVAPSPSAVLYAGTGGWGVARSTSGGEHWRIGVETGLNAAFAPALKLHPSRPDTAYVLQANGRRTFRSTDGGRSWEPFARDLTARGLYDLAFDPVDPDLLYAAGDGGIAKSVDGGDTWQPLGGPASRRIALLGSKTLLAGDCGLSRSVDGGRSWAQVIPCLYANGDSGNDDRRTPLAIWADPRDSRVAYVHFSLTGGTHDVLFQVFRTRDGGATWNRLAALQQPTAFAVAPGSSKLLYALDYSPQASRLLRSEDGGTSWKVAYSHLPADAEVYSIALAVDAVDPFKLYLGAVDGLLISHDGGRTLELDRTPFEAGKTGVAQLWTDRIRPGLVYAASAFGGLFVGRFE